MKKSLFLLTICAMLFALGWHQNPSTGSALMKQNNSQPGKLQKTLSVGDTLILIAPDNDTVTIARDDYGVPHITANTETGVFYGQGFAAARDRLFQMETNRRAAEGKLAEWFGSNYVNTDKQTLTMYYRHSEVVQQFDDLPMDLQNVFTAYTAGINAYVDSMNANPVQYKPYDFTLPGFEMEPWTVYKSVAVFDFIGRRFGQFGGNELQREYELQQHGWEWFNQYRPINDPNAPTTIPDGSLAASRNWHYSGMTLSPETVRYFEQRSERIDSLLQSKGIPKKFGSFEVQITSSNSLSGNVMLLGCPQMNDPGYNNVNPINEVELNCPSLHVGGSAIAGIPMVIIGHNDNCAWTWTSGYSDNTDIYIDSTFDSSYSSYWYNGQWLPFEEYVDTILVAGASPVIFTHYRTVHGPVNYLINDLSMHHVFSYKMTFWNEESGTAKFVYGQDKARNIAQLESALSLSTLSFNVFCIDRNQNVKYWHSGKYQDRTDGVDPRLPHKGDGSEEWGGFRQFSDLPHAADPPQGYFINWNNKPVSWWDNGDNGPWWPGTVVYDHVLLIKNYVDPISPFSYSNLENVQPAIDAHGTYQEAIELPSSGEIMDSNLCPPGQSAFVDVNRDTSLHFHDQWPLYVNWEFKDQIFGNPIPVEIEERANASIKFSLQQNYPNPFNPSTKIKYYLAKSGKVKLKIFDVLGTEVATLVNKYQNSGSYEVSFDASKLSSGVYFYRIQTGSNTAVKKMILLK
jgi:acyl-homoserine lactone acylase PvdQ